MRFFLASCVIGTCICTSVLAEGHPGSAELTGAEILKTFQDKKITDSLHYQYRLHADGRMDGVEMYSHFTGKWHVQENKLCWTVDDPQATEECFSVRHDDQEFHFSNDHESWSGSVYTLDIAQPPPPEKI